MKRTLDDSFALAMSALDAAIELPPSGEARLLRALTEDAVHSTMEQLAGALEPPAAVESRLLERMGNDVAAGAASATDALPKRPAVRAGAERPWRQIAAWSAAVAALAACFALGRMTASPPTTTVVADADIERARWLREKAELEQALARARAEQAGGPPTAGPPVASSQSPDVDLPEAVVFDGEPGYLTIVCSPFCDDVWVDGRSLGPSPIVGHAVAPGAHDLRMKKAGVADRRLVVHLVAGSVTARRVDMTTVTAPPVETVYPPPAEASPPPSVERPVLGAVENETVRRSLAPKVWAGRASESEVKMLKAACAALGDRECRDRAASLLKKKLEGQPPGN